VIPNKTLSRSFLVSKSHIRPNQVSMMYFPK